MLLPLLNLEKEVKIEIQLGPLAHESASFLAKMKHKFELTRHLS